GSVRGFLYDGGGIVVGHDLSETAAHDGVIVGDQNAHVPHSTTAADSKPAPRKRRVVGDWARPYSSACERGTTTRTVVPFPFSPRMEKVPPSRFARSRIPAIPNAEAPSLMNSGIPIPLSHICSVSSSFAAAKSTVTLSAEAW